MKSIFSIGIFLLIVSVSSATPRMQYIRWVSERNINGFIFNDEVGKGDILVKMLEAFNREIFNDSLNIYVVIGEDLAEYESSGMRFTYLGFDEKPFSLSKDPDRYRFWPWQYPRTKATTYRALCIYTSEDYPYKKWLQALYSACLCPELERRQKNIDVRGGHVGTINGLSTDSLPPITEEQNKRLDKILNRDYKASTSHTLRFNSGVNILYHHPYFWIYKLKYFEPWKTGQENKNDAVGELLCGFTNIEDLRCSSTGDLLVKNGYTYYYYAIAEKKLYPSFVIPQLSEFLSIDNFVRKDSMVELYGVNRHEITYKYNLHSQQVTVDTNSVTRGELEGNFYSYFNRLWWKTVNLSPKTKTIYRFREKPAEQMLTLGGMAIAFLLVMYAARKINRSA